MGIKTTHIITRQVALEIISSKLQEAADDVISDILESFPESHFRNYDIVSEEEFLLNETKEYPMPEVDSIEKFN